MGCLMSSVSGNLSGRFLHVLFIVIAMVSVQSGASLAKMLFPLVGAAGATSLRLMVGACALMLFFRPWRSRWSAGNLAPLLVYGVVLGGMNFLFYQSILTLPLGVAVAFEFTGPLLVAILGSRRLIDFLWIVLAIAGLLLLLPIGHFLSNIDITGAMYALAAGACWALYIIFGKKSGTKNGAATAALGTFIGAICFAPIGIWQNGMALLAPEVLPLAIGVGILSTALPFSLEMIALTKIPARTFGTLMSLEPVVAAFSGLLLIGERLTVQQWTAVLAIMIASVGATLTIKTSK